MRECKKCGHRIKDDTDDNYNITHTQIQCPECDNWQSAYEETACSPSELNDGLALLLEKWRKRSDRFERDYQFGRDGKDDNTYVHGKCDMLDECIDELVEAMKG